MHVRKTLAQYVGVGVWSESDLSDFFYQMDVDEEDGFLICIWLEIFGSGKLNKASMGYLNAVFFCLFIMYWIHVDLRHSKCTEQHWKSNLPGQENFHPGKACQICSDQASLVAQHMDDLICSGSPNLPLENRQSRNISAHFGSKGWLFNDKKKKRPSFDARSFRAFQINSTSESSFEIQGKPEALLAMETMAGTLIDMEYGIRRHLLSFPGKIVAYALVWPSLVDKAIECISALTSGRSRIDKRTFCDEQTRVPFSLRSLAQTFLHLIRTNKDRRRIIHFQDFVMVWADTCPEGGGLTALTQEGDTLELQAGYSDYLNSTHPPYVELKMLAVVIRNYRRAYKRGDTNMLGGNDLFANKLILYFTGIDSGAFGIILSYLKGGKHHRRLIKEIWGHIDGMGSACKAYHVAGSRMDIQGEDKKSRQKNIISSLPDMWLEAMSSIIPPSSLFWILELFLGDLGEQLPWHAKPHELAGRVLHIVAEPYAAETTLSNIREAANIDLTTAVIVFIPRMFTEWYQLARKFVHLGEFQ